MSTKILIGLFCLLSVSGFGCSSGSDTASDPAADPSGQADLVGNRTLNEKCTVEGIEADWLCSSDLHLVCRPYTDTWRCQAIGHNSDWCTKDSQCSSGFCAPDAHCFGDALPAPKTFGANCQNPWDCDDPYACVNSHCEMESSQCAHDHECRSNYCVYDYLGDTDGNGMFQSLTPGRCAKGPHASLPNQGSSCPYWGCPNGMVCRPMIRAGRFERCEPTGMLGDPCAEDADCVSGLNCADNQCAQP
jgi:hypothetical protein